MNTIGDEELQAWLDGELDDGHAARVAAAVAADPVLAARAARERGLRDALRAEFAPVLDEPVPQRLRALLADPAGAPADRARPQRSMPEHRPGSPHHPSGDAAGRAAGGDNVVPLPTRAERSPRLRWSAPLYALAASVAVLAVGVWLKPGSGPVRLEDGRLTAGPELARGLDAALASAPDPGSPVEVGLTFRDAAGHVCRSFVLRGNAPLAGLACRDAGVWTLPVLGAQDASDTGAVRQAGSALPPAVQAAVDARLQGEVFDAAEERAARANGWR